MSYDVTEDADVLTEVPALARLEQLDRSLERGAPVAVLDWPDQELYRLQLRDQGLPRLLVLAPGTSPAAVGDILEDWVRLPVSQVDVRARLRRLRTDAGERPPRPLLAGDGRLLYRDRWAGLSRLQERVVAPLVDNFERPVPHRLLRDAWTDGPVTASAMGSCLKSLRQHLHPLGLEIVTLRHHGCLLQARP